MILQKLLTNMISKKMFEGAKEIRSLNETMPVNGKRYQIPLMGRYVEIVYYEVKKENAPIILALHGGGYVFGGEALDDKLWKDLSDTLEVNVASVDYRMAPEYKYPCAIKDVYETAVYLKNNADIFGFDKNHIALFGNSAGGNLAVATTIYAKEMGDMIQFDCMILNYPHLDKSKSPKEKGSKGMELITYDIFDAVYSSVEEKFLPKVSPLLCKKEMLKSLPPAIISVAESDILRGDGEQFYKLMKNNGNKAVIDVAKEMPHGYYEFSYGEEQSYMSKKQKQLYRSGKIQTMTENTLKFFKNEYFKMMSVE